MTTRPASATRAIGALALLLAASGCVTSTSSAPPDFRFLDGSENGLVLVSFSQWGTKWKYRLVPATGASGSRELLLSGVGGKEPLWIGATVVVMGAIGAITNAVNDALAPYGVVAERQEIVDE